jgi:exportin-1
MLPVRSDDSLSGCFEYASSLCLMRFLFAGRFASLLRAATQVIIVEDENGEIVKERTVDTASIALYNTMRETLVYLTHLDAEDTRTIMLEKMTRQCKGGFAWRELNTLCWAIGSIAGSMTENAEKRFLVVAIRDLLQLCEVSRGKDNKAVIASNIMYIVGSYPRFLQAHWQFLRTVIMKLFEFMHETFPGVQDMACDTFITIAKDCRKQFVKPRPPRGMFVETALQMLPSIIADLSHQQIPTFYEAVGYMIRAHPDENTRQALLNALMTLPNQTWARTMAAAAQNFECLKQPDTARGLANILRTNVRVAKTLGNSYISQLSRIFLDMLNVYKAYSEVISTTVGTMGMRLDLVCGCLFSCGGWWWW